MIELCEPGDRKCALCVGFGAVRDHECGESARSGGLHDDRRGEPFWRSDRARMAELASVRIRARPCRVHEESSAMSKPPSLSDPEHRRAGELDALSAILSWEGRDKLATILTDEDVATLKHLAEAGMGENTLRALTSDLGYLEAWALAATSNRPALAGARGPGVEVRGASSLGPGEARGGSRPRHAGFGRGGSLPTRSSEGQWAACGLRPCAGASPRGRRCTNGVACRRRSTRRASGRRWRSRCGPRAGRAAARAAGR